MAEAGKNLITGLWNGIRGAFDGVVEKVKKLVEKLPTAVKKVLGIKSPSTVFAEIGGYLAEGLGVGWEDSIKKVNAEIGKDLNYKGNIEVDSTFKDDFEEGLQVAANGLGASVPTAANEDNSSLEGATIIINDSISLDGTPLKDVVAKYTIQKIGNEMRTMKVSRGGFNAI
jgi:phage-related protein